MANKKHLLAHTPGRDEQEVLPNGRTGFATKLMLIIGLILLTATAQAAWWNTDWEGKTAIRLPNQDLNTGTTIQIRNIDMTTLTAMADLNDVRIVDENTNTQLDRICDGTSTSIDANCYFRMPNSLTAGDAARNTTYYLYYNNTSAGNPPTGNAARTTVCGFEEGEICFYTKNQGSEITDWNRFDSNGYQIEADEELELEGQANLETRKDLNYTTWMLDVTGQSTGASLRIENSATKEMCKIYVNNGAIKDSSGATIISHTAATWYKLEIGFRNEFPNPCKHAVYDYNGTPLGWTQTAHVEALSDNNTVNIINATVNTGEGNVYFDNFFLGTPTIATTQAIGAILNFTSQTTGNVIYSENTALGGDGFSFTGTDVNIPFDHMPTGGTVTVNFNNGRQTYAFLTPEQENADTNTTIRIIPDTNGTTTAEYTTGQGGLIEQGEILIETFNADTNTFQTIGQMITNANGEIFFYADTNKTARLTATHGSYQTATWTGLLQPIWENTDTIPLIAGGEIVTPITATMTCIADAGTRITEPRQVLIVCDARTPTEICFRRYQNGAIQAADDCNTGTAGWHTINVNLQDTNYFVQVFANDTIFASFTFEYEPSQFATGNWEWAFPTPVGSVQNQNAFIILYIMLIVASAATGALFSKGLDTFFIGSIFLTRFPGVEWYFTPIAICAVAYYAAKLIQPYWSR